MNSYPEHGNTLALDSWAFIISDMETTHDWKRLSPRILHGRVQSIPAARGDEDALRSVRRISDLATTHWREEAVAALNCELPELRERVSLLVDQYIGLSTLLRALEWKRSIIANGPPVPSEPYPELRWMLEGVEALACCDEAEATRPQRPSALEAETRSLVEDLALFGARIPEEVFRALQRLLQGLRARLPSEVASHLLKALLDGAGEWNLQPMPTTSQLDTLVESDESACLQQDISARREREQVSRSLLSVAGLRTEQPCGAHDREACAYISNATEPGYVDSESGFSCIAHPVRDVVRWALDGMKQLSDHVQDWRTEESLARMLAELRYPMAGSLAILITSAFEGVADWFNNGDAVWNRCDAMGVSNEVSGFTFDMDSLADAVRKFGLAFEPWHQDDPDVLEEGYTSAAYSFMADQPSASRARWVAGWVLNDIKAWLARGESKPYPWTRTISLFEDEMDRESAKALCTLLSDGLRDHQITAPAPEDNLS